MDHSRLRSESVVNRVPELNGVANAIVMLKHRRSDADIEDSILELEKFCRYIDYLVDHDVQWYEFLLIDSNRQSVPQKNIP